jgi:hypothetical protein
MMSRKMKLLSAAIGAAVLIATPALVRAVHKEGTPVAQARDRAHGHAYNADAVIGPDGKLIGAASDPNVRSYLQRDGLPN